MSGNLRNIIDQVPYSLRELFASICSPRAAVIRSNYDFLHGAVAMASRTPHPHGINSIYAAELRTWITTNQKEFKDKTFETLTPSDLSDLKRYRELFTGESAPEPEAVTIKTVRPH